MAPAPSLKDYWSDGAPAYAAFSREGGLLPLHEEILRLPIFGNPESRLNVLDVACGDGEPACSLAKRLQFSQVIATDFAPGMVKLANERAESMNLTNIRFSVADAMNLRDFDSGSFDVLTCIAALFMVPDAKMALQEFKRVLKPGGLLLFTTWGKPEDTNIANAFHQAKERLAHSKAPPGVANMEPSKLSSQEGLNEIVSTAGFTDVSIRDFNLVFDFPRHCFDYPDGAMMKHPMMTMSVAQLELAGVDNPTQALTEQILKVFAELGYGKEGSNLVFPRNVALIVTARA